MRQPNVDGGQLVKNYFSEGKKVTVTKLSYPQNLSYVGGYCDDQDPACSCAAMSDGEDKVANFSVSPESA